MLPSFAAAQPADSNENIGPASAPAGQPEAQPAVQPIDKRIFGVLPNYRTADGSVPFEPITTKHKFYIAAKDSFDYPIYFLSGGFAGISQIENSNPSFGQGVNPKLSRARLTSARRTTARAASAARPA